VFFEKVTRKHFRDEVSGAKWGEVGKEEWYENVVRMR
jgi:hypothetical protein